jgi:hypothetical protein
VLVLIALVKYVLLPLVGSFLCILLNCEYSIHSESATEVEVVVSPRSGRFASPWHVLSIPTFVGVVEHDPRMKTNPIPPPTRGSYLSRSTTVKCGLRWRTTGCNIILWQLLVNQAVLHSSSGLRQMWLNSLKLESQYFLMFWSGCNNISKMRVYINVHMSFYTYKTWYSHYDVQKWYSEYFCRLDTP